ncbi:hypothetical protein Q3A66_20770 [Hymenobacter sp. BT770]|uniref:hypothetical protein n=1 Tax=Hymenobacter sp. BT770 TaxID=2886942 RepID=UPI001D100A47|nr:hypothetical protein [Hymenobacter sp. BT770]MCC3155501.1 hypothetical protein [Hymenobacter sp. BT770]MDO3417508.1 hypothetical protein [Hymenobacter sp. BT770]
MKRIAAYLLVGFGLTSCAESVPDPAPSLVGKWEQLTVHTVYKDRNFTQFDDDQWVNNDAGSVWLEFAADGCVNLVHNGVATPTETTYTYQGGRITFRGTPLGETHHPVLELSDHRLVYHTHTDKGVGTEDVTFTYKR